MNIGTVQQKTTFKSIKGEEENKKSVALIQDLQIYKKAQGAYQPWSFVLLQYCFTNAHRLVNQVKPHRGFNGVKLNTTPPPSPPIVPSSFSKSIKKKKKKV